MSGDIIFDLYKYDPEEQPPTVIHKAIKEIEYLRQQLAHREAQIVMLRGLLLRYRNETPVGNQPHMICHETDEALTATADLDGLIMCHAKPTVETLSVVTNTGYVYVRAIDRKVEPNTKLFSAWEPK